MKICFFEDTSVPGLFPVNILRHTSQILCGILSIKEKNECLLGNTFSTSLHCRKQLTSFCKEQFPRKEINQFSNDEYLFLNSRIIYTKSILDGLLLIQDEMKNTMILHQKDIVAFHISRDKVYKIKNIINSGNGLISLKSLSALKLKQIQLSQLNNDEVEEIKIIGSPADLINYFEDEINNDFNILLKRNRANNKKRVNAELINPSKIIIEQDCNINKSVVFDATGGPIYISRKSTIEPFTYIIGPVFVGENSTIRSGSKLYGPVRVGNHCKVSGEITSSIFHSYVNKQHLGFIGHSYICEWVNLGAGTTTSNLKNNYSKISMKMRDTIINTGSIFLGSIIGDHTKTGISTMLNTGTIVGISSNLFGGGYQPKFLDSFSWADSSGTTTSYDIEKALHTAKISMKRRNVEMTGAYENLFKLHFKK